MLQVKSSHLKTYGSMTGGSAALLLLIFPFWVGNSARSVFKHPNLQQTPRLKVQRNLVWKFRAARTLRRLFSLTQNFQFISRPGLTLFERSFSPVTVKKYKAFAIINMPPPNAWSGRLKGSGANLASTGSALPNLENTWWKAQNSSAKVDSSWTETLSSFFSKIHFVMTLNAELLCPYIARLRLRYAVMDTNYMFHDLFKRGILWRKSPVIVSRIWVGRIMDVWPCMLLLAFKI